MKLENAEIWCLTGSQTLYGAAALKEVDAHSRSMIEELKPKISCPLVFKGVMIEPSQITQTIREANSSVKCVGVLVWMHTFSPAKMWIAGLSELKKPLLHLHTQYNRDIPWATIDMNFMNINQSAHGDREFGHICARLRLKRKIVVGHYRESSVHDRIDAWARASAAWADGRNLKVSRFGDNMREVSVTEGDKVEAQLRFGWSVNGYGLGGLAHAVSQVSDGEADKVIDGYKQRYELDAKALGAAGLASLRYQAKIEKALRGELESHGAHALTTNFEDLHGLDQLPGIAIQNLMADGYGFGAEGDWKTSALVRGLKVMAQGLRGGVSFMEDYTYHLDPDDSLCLGSHMMEVCPSIASHKARVEVHPLSIGGKADPARLVFDGSPGKALNASLIDLGDRFRLVVNTLESVDIVNPMPKLPVARVLWQPDPDLRSAAEAWILAGAAHHSAYTNALTVEHLEDWAEIAGVELVLIDDRLDLRSLRSALRANDTFHRP